MKKLLALVLALVMVMGLSVVSTNATFKDDEQIDHSDAVEVMNALNIINGYEDGSYKPDLNVTRAQMAKMVAIALLGEIDPNAFVGAASDLKDITGHWAEGYIKFCVSQGIVAGKGNGVFDPDANVTTAEAAKMLLVALGYNADVRKYVGSQWTLAVMRDAQQKGLLDKLTKAGTNTDMDRDDAAQMIYNTLTAVRVVENQSINAQTGEVTLAYVNANTLNNEPNTMLTKTFDATEYIGTMDLRNTIGYATASKKYTYGAINSGAVYGATFADKSDVTVVANRINNFTTDKDYTKYAGEEVTVTAVKAKDGTLTVLNVAPTGKTKTLVTPQSAIEAVTGNAKQIKVDGTTYDIANAGTATQAGLVDPYSYDVIKLVDVNQNGEFDNAMTVTVNAGKVTFANSSETIVGGTTYKTSDNNTLASGIAKDGYAAATKTVASQATTNTYFNVEALEKLSGKVEGYKATPTRQVLVNGTWYNFKTGEFTADVAGKDVTFYAVNGVVVEGSSEIVSNTTLDNVVLVYAVDGAAVVVNRQAKILKTDGTKENVTIDTSGTGTVANPTAGTMYTYSTTDKGVRFKAITEDIGDYTYVAGAANVAGTPVATIGGNNIADDAKVFVYNAGKTDASLITGKQLKAINVGAGNTNVTNTSILSFTGKSATGLTRVMLAGVNAATATFAAGNEASLYALVVEDAYKVDGDYITYKIWDGSSVVTVREKDTSAATIAARTKLALVAYSALDGDVIKDADAAGDIAASVQGLSNKKDVVWLNGQTDGTHNFKLTGDTVYMYYDSSADDAADIGKAGGELQLADKIGSSYAQNVRYITDGVASPNGVIKFVLIDVKNNIGTKYTTTMAPAVTAAASGATAAVKAGTAASLKAGDTLTLTVTGTAASEVRVTLTDGVGGEQVQKVTIPTGGTIDLDFLMPASTYTVAVADKVTYTAIGNWAGTVNGITSATGAVKAGTYYEGDTVEITVTTGQAATGAATVTLTGTTTGLATVSAATTNVTKNAANYTLAAGAAAQTFTFSVTATAGETAPAISIT